MKIPKKPNKPNKPKNPSKTRAIKNNLLVEYCTENRALFSIKEILDKAPNGVSVENVFVEVCSDYSFDDYSSPEITFYYSSEEEDPNYDKRLEKYKKKLEVYAEKLKKYKEEHKVWKEKNKFFLEQKKIIDAVQDADPEKLAEIAKSLT
jgi:hypothetical protein